MSATAQQAFSILGRLNERGQVIALDFLARLEKENNSCDDEVLNIADELIDRHIVAFRALAQ